VRETLGDWLMLLGAAITALSLFLVWSHQLPPGVRAAAGSGVPAAPTAWQVYSAADVLLALLVVAVAYVAFAGSRAVRVTTTVAALVALAFVLHAHGTPPTDGVALAPPLGPVHATPGAGESVATAGLIVALAGLGLSFTA
jgi:hypothetical protein